MEYSFSGLKDPAVWRAIRQRQGLELNTAKMLIPSYYYMCLLLILSMAGGGGAVMRPPHQFQATLLHSLIFPPTTLSSATFITISPSFVILGGKNDCLKFKSFNVAS